MSAYRCFLAQEFVFLISHSLLTIFPHFNGSSTTKGRIASYAPTCFFAHALVNGILDVFSRASSESILRCQTGEILQNSDQIPLIETYASCF